MIMKLAVLLVRVNAMTVSPSVISWVMLTEDVAMAAHSGDMVGYLCVLFLMKPTLFALMLMG